jgi:hypothetical protein
MDKRNEHSTNSNHGNGFVLGLIIGVIITLLFSTKKGREFLRDWIDKGMSKFADLEDILKQQSTQQPQEEENDYIHKPPEQKQEERRFLAQEAEVIPPPPAQHSVQEPQTPPEWRPIEPPAASTEIKSEAKPVKKEETPKQKKRLFFKRK